MRYVSGTLSKEMKEARKSGLSLKKIADKFGVSVTTVNRHTNEETERAIIRYEILRKAKNKKKRIVSAAIKYHNIILSMPRPNRHPDIINTVAKNRSFMADIGIEAEQGFLASDGNFYNRKEALKIATDSRQGFVRKVLTDELYSENLW